MERKFYIDRLRIFLTVLVIFHHTSIAFGASGGWYYTVQDKITGWQEGLMSVFMTVDQSFFMSFFFLISAFFMPASYDRKGAKKFIIDRFWRLFLPLLVFTFVINPLLIYGIYFDKFTNFFDCFSFYGVGPMWFVMTLLIFEFTYVLYRLICKKRLSDYFSDKLPSTPKILAFIIFTGLVAFLIRQFCYVGVNFFGLQLGYFSLYIFMYLVGILACRKKWFDKITLSGARLWLYVALGTLITLIICMLTLKGEGSFNGGFNIKALFYAMWEPWMCVSICYFLLAWCRTKFNTPSTSVSRLSADSYAAYIFHPIAVVGMTFAVDLLPINPLIKIIITTALAATLAFGFSDLLRKIPFLKRIL